MLHVHFICVGLNSHCKVKKAYSVIQAQNKPYLAGQTNTFQLVLFADASTQNTQVMFLYDNLKWDAQVGWPNTVGWFTRAKGVPNTNVNSFSNTGQAFNLDDIQGNSGQLGLKVISYILFFIWTK